MAGFPDEGISFDEEDSGPGGNPVNMNMNMNGVPHFDLPDYINGNHNIPPDVIMADDGDEEYLMAGRSAGNLDDVSRNNVFQNLQREAEPQRVAPVEMDFTVDTASLDLDTHVGSHKGLMKTQRLLHVAKHCPPLRVDALKMALKNVQSSSADVALYTKLHEELKNALQSGLKGEDGDATLPKLDDVWVREAKKTHDAKMDKLEHDLKNYKANSIKESIRRGHDEIGFHFLAAGDATSALKAFNNSRDYAEGLKEQAHMLANRLRACVYLRYFPNPNQLQEQMRDIETGLERASATAVKEARAKDAKDKESGVVGGPSVVVTDKALESNCNLIRACMALYHMSVQEYTIAADLFISLNPESSNTFPEVIVGRDIAVYGALCALARYDRQALKEKVITNKGFKSFLESAPEIRRLVETFYNSQFSVFLKSFKEQRNGLLLDVLLAPHVDVLMSEARTDGMLEFFRCYDSVSLSDMALEFCHTPSDLQAQLTTLILSGRLPGRIDVLHGTLNRHTSNVLMETAQKIKQHIDVLRSHLHISLLRTNLARHGLVVRNNKGEEAV